MITHLNETFDYILLPRFRTIISNRWEDKKSGVDLPFAYLFAEFSLEKAENQENHLPMILFHFALDAGSIFVNYSHRVIVRVDYVHHNLFCSNGRPILFHPFKSIANSGSATALAVNYWPEHRHTHTRITIRNVLSLMFVENQRHQNQKLYAMNAF